MDLGTVEEIVVARDRADLGGGAPGDLFLAGGSWVFSEPQVGAKRLIDLTGLGWPALVATEAGLEIAATCTLAELAGIDVPTEWPALALARQCCDALRGSFKIWNVATVGGNLCCALPAGPMASLTVALGGSLLIWTPDGGERRLLAQDFVLGDGSTALAAGEVVRSIALPAAALRARTAMRQASLTPLGRSAALLIGRVDPDSGALTLMISASTPRPIVLEFAELPDPAGLLARIDARLPGAGAYFDDVHGAPAWRQQLTRVLALEILDELTP